VSHSLVKALKAVPGFSTLDETTLLSIVGASSNLFWRAGSTIFRQGSPGDSLYVILSGHVRIFDEDDREIDEERLQTGDYFGERSLVLDMTRAKCAEAVEDTELLVLPKQAFEAVMAANPGVAEHVRERLEQFAPAAAPSGPSSASRRGAARARAT
jgi:CRP-like cAMP-binding protein